MPGSRQQVKILSLSTAARLKGGLKERQAHKAIQKLSCRSLTLEMNTFYSAVELQVLSNQISV